MRLEAGSVCAVRTTLLAALALVAVAAGFAGSSPALAAPSITTPSAATSCPGTTPQDDRRQGYNYGNGALEVRLWPGGTLTPGPLPGGGIYAEAQPDGSIVAKLGWWREVDGRLSIEGERLDASAAPLRARIPDGYGDRGFQSTLLTFPEPGCVGASSAASRARS